MEKQIEIYKSGNGETQIEVKFGQETVWLSQKNMSDLFEKDTDTIGLHLKNIYAEEELDPGSTTEDFSVVQKEGKRNVKRTIKFYNLDAVISVGYRVNSKRGTQFRQWATQRLKDYLIQGYAINEKRLAQKNQQVQTLKDGIRILSRAIEYKVDEVDTAWLAHFAKGLELLDDYDHEALDQKGITQRAASYPDLSAYQNIIGIMRQDFSSSVFGKEKDDSFRSSVAQIGKGFGEVDFYPSIEEKAATLLYLIIKNHSFVDGNKRIAAACFLLFLEVNGLLKAKETPIISNEALASLTLFAAASKPEEMETVKKLIVSVLNRNQ
ncbi:virulence protein RhuM/Fic/DOC family protein [Dyadobacter crusticola]|uniref:virulence protein RhuM/Fic/DOC family protein n=1 Tax=Dyadobacter crusticola TaxID=292407 RepID=UPI0004E20662|nr:virulence protein RhuM/Fic/DOC family protein [Dyadobacter crusticola]